MPLCLSLSLCVSSGLSLSLCLSLSVCGALQPHLPFVASEQFFDDYYPPSEIELPPNQQPPEGMPPVAWSSYGEIRAYSDINALNATGAPGTVLPKQDVLDLRRAYYASVTQTDFMLGKVMAELKSGPFASNTVVSIWGDHGWQLVSTENAIAPCSKRHPNSRINCFAAKSVLAH